MDRQTLHGGGNEEAGGFDRRTMRRSSTEVDATGRSRGYPSGEDGQEMISHSSQSNRISAMNRNYEDEISDNDVGVDDQGAARRGSPRRDSRKSIEVTTPTLVDEEDVYEDEEEEQEMVSLERERLRHSSRAFLPQDSDLRRTPGAQMYKSNLHLESMRRTPGASQMHRSAGSGAAESGATGDAAALGFGLTLSTPVARSSSRGEGGSGSKPIDLSTAWEQSSHSSSDSPKAGTTSADVARPPLAPGGSSRDQRGGYVAPWTLSRTAQLESGRGVYSPNTLRLTEDLGNLLLEDDDAAQEPSRNVNHFVFSDDVDRTDGKQGSESWTEPYVVSMDAPSRVPRSVTGRNRRLKTDSFRRSRGGLDRQSQARYMEDQGQQSDTGGFLPYAQQPKPVRSVQPQPFGNCPPGSFSFGQAAPNFVPSAPAPSFGQTAQNTGASYNGPNNEADTTPRLLNFGGAFAPPSKTYGGSINRPGSLPAGTDPHGVPGTNVQPQFSASDLTPFAPPTFTTFQPTPPPHFGSHPGKFQPQFGTQTTMFGGNQGINQSPTFSFPPQNVGYPIHSTGMHPPPQEYIPIHNHQRPPIAHFGPTPQAPPPQLWPQAMPMQYDGMPMEQGGWHNTHGGWLMEEYGYGMPRSNEPSVSMTPSPHTWTPEPELVNSESQSQHNQFSAISQPGPPPSSALNLGQAQAGSNRGKKGRSGSRKGVKTQGKNERGQKLEPSNQAFTGKKSLLNTKNKKKQTKDKPTPQVPGSNPKLGEEATNATADEQAEAKRAELTETPATRSAFKDFYRKFRAQERISIKDAEAFAKKSLSDDSLPETIHWKVYLELADLAKRANKFVEARRLYQAVCRLQPYAGQGWLEYSKLEEECGNMNICAKILRAGLEYCQYSENLLTRAIKHEEKMGNLGRARELLSRLKHVGIEKVWRTVLEGALLEARAGNDVMARRVLKYLMHHVPWYGPLYLEAYRLERDLGRSQKALAIVERGLAAIPRYGPLWFGAFRLCEELDLSSQSYYLPRSMGMIERATYSISKELIWKVHLEAAQMLERAAVEYLDSSTDPTADEILNLSRKRFAMTILSCPPNLRWKVWLAAGRMEIAAGNIDNARKLFLRAHQVVPDKGRAAALLECARLEEFVGDTDLATAILTKSRCVSGSDWKVWLESVLVEMRCGNHERAIELGTLALKLHSGTGRLWASLVQLRHFDGGEESQFAALRLALHAVPKSGEVWCEGARIHLNPFSRNFDLARSRRHIFFATKFTPQYGDGFLETLRLEILEQWLLPISKMIWENTRDNLVLSEGGDGHEEIVKYVYSVARAIFAVCTKDDEQFSKETDLDEATGKLVRNSLKPSFRDKVLDISHLQLRCANADPNYGALWFNCRIGPTDTARKILTRGVKLMFDELREYAHIYLSGLIRRFAILARFDYEQEQRRNKEGYSEKDGASEDWEDLVNEGYLATPSLKTIIDTGNKKRNDETGMDLLESTVTASNFVTGLVQVNTQTPVGELPAHQRRKILFGTDALFS